MAGVAIAPAHEFPLVLRVVAGHHISVELLRVRLALAPHRRPPPMQPAEILPRALAHDREVSGSGRDTYWHRRLRAGSGPALPDTAGVRQGRSQTCMARRPAARWPAFSPPPQTSPTHPG